MRYALVYLHTFEPLTQKQIIMKTASRFVLLTVFAMTIGTFTSCKDKEKDADGFEVTDDTISTKEELGTTATDTVKVN